jgi:hypothetical protein
LRGKDLVIKFGQACTQEPIKSQHEHEYKQNDSGDAQTRPP